MILRHGTIYGYKHCKPRCAQCRKAESRYREDLRNKRNAELTPDDPRHGKTRLYYTANCRCEKCTEYERLRLQAYRKAQREARKAASLQQQ